MSSILFSTFQGKATLVGNQGYVCRPFCFPRCKVKQHWLVTRVRLSPILSTLQNFVLFFACLNFYLLGVNQYVREMVVDKGLASIFFPQHTNYRNLRRDKTKIEENKLFLLSKTYIHYVYITICVDHHYCKN